MQVELLPGVEQSNRLGEGVLWHPIRHSLWWVDIDRRRIFEWRGSSKKLRHWTFDQAVSALVPSTDRSLILVQAHGIQRFCPGRKYEN